jgi:hypothetical protein
VKAFFLVPVVGLVLVVVMVVVMVVVSKGRGPEEA